MKFALRVFRHSLFEKMLDACDVDEESLKDLLVRCSECRQFVLWNKASERNYKSGKQAQVEPYFKHKKDTEQTKLCEKRVAKYDKKFIDSHNRKQKYNRQKFIRDRFWNLFTGYYDSIDFHVSSTLNEYVKNNKALGKMGEIMVGSFRNKQDIKEVYDNLRSMIDGAFSDTPIILGVDQMFHDLGIPIGLEVSPQLQEHFRETVCTKLDRKLHTEICIEVLDYLLTPKALPILEDLFRLGICVVLDAIRDSLVEMGTAVTAGFLEMSRYDLIPIKPISEMSFPPDPLEFEVKLNFLGNEFNRMIFSHYVINHIIAWIVLVPWNLAIEQQTSNRLQVAR